MEVATIRPNDGAIVMRRKRKGIDMADEKKWKESEGGEKQEGKGGVSSPEPSSAGEVEGHTRQLVASCFKCGTTSYVGADWKWFTCWKCGGTSSDTAMA